METTTPESDFDVHLPAEDWQLSLIDQMMMYAKIDDASRNELQVRLNDGLSYQEAANTITWMDQFVDKDFRSARAINKMVNDKMKNPEA